jgi:hypothetical protein
MRKVMRWRYYCEFCKKSGGSSGHMAKHEKACTMNLDRVCGMCKVLGQEQPDLKELMALLPNPEDYLTKHEIWEGFPGLDGAIERLMPELREKSGNCPACILAALRQKKIFVSMINSFNFTEECKAFWADINERNFRNDYHEPY